MWWLQTTKFTPFSENLEGYLKVENGLKIEEKS
jgi:hypothetical protein